MMPGEELPHNDEVSARVLAACADDVRVACGVELVRVMITGDALTDGYLLAGALRAGEAAPDAVAALHALN